MTETTVNEFGKEIKMRINCNAINIPSQKNYLACALSKNTGGVDHILYFKIDPNNLVISNHLDKIGKTIELGEFGW